MEAIVSAGKATINAIANMTTEQIALLSLVVSLILYLLGKRYDIKLKKYDAKKQNYENFMALFFDIFKHVKNDQDITKNQELQSKFFQAGSSLAIYGSKKMYKLYVLSRSLEGNPLLEKKQIL